MKGEAVLGYLTSSEEWKKNNKRTTNLCFLSKEKGINL
jgi:hypothetical protein